MNLEVDNTILEDYGAGFEGTTALRDKYIKDTPGQRIQQFKTTMKDTKEKLETEIEEGNSFGGSLQSLGFVRMTDAEVKKAYYKWASKIKPGFLGWEQPMGRYAVGFGNDGRFFIVNKRNPSEIDFYSGEKATLAAVRNLKEESELDEAQGKTVESVYNDLSKMSGSALRGILRRMDHPDYNDIKDQGREDIIAEILMSKFGEEEALEFLENPDNFKMSKYAVQEAVTPKEISQIKNEFDMELIPQSKWAKTYWTNLRTVKQLYGIPQGNGEYDDVYFVIYDDENKPYGVVGIEGTSMYAKFSDAKAGLKFALNSMEESLQEAVSKIDVEELLDAAAKMRKEFPQLRKGQSIMLTLHNMNPKLYSMAVDKADAFTVDAKIPDLINFLDPKYYAESANLDEAMEPQNTSYGYYGTVDVEKYKLIAYKEMADKVLKIVRAKKIFANFPNITSNSDQESAVVKYLDSKHGRHIADGNDSPAYIEKDFTRFLKDFSAGHYMESFDLEEASNFVSKGIYTLDGKKIDGARSSKLFLQALGSDGFLHNLSWKEWSESDLKDTSSDNAKKQFVDRLAKQIKMFNKRIDLNTWLKGGNRSFIDTVNYIFKLDPNIKYSKASGLKEESLQEAINIRDYSATSEKSQFGGYRPKVVSKDGKTLYLSAASYNTPDEAKDHAEDYLKQYVRGISEPRVPFKGTYVKESTEEISLEERRQMKIVALATGSTDLDKIYEYVTSQPVQYSSVVELKESFNKYINTP
jgi:hypothetical protein